MCHVDLKMNAIFVTNTNSSNSTSTKQGLSIVLIDMDYYRDRKNSQLKIISEYYNSTI